MKIQLLKIYNFFSKVLFFLFFGFYKIEKKIFLDERIITLDKLHNFVNNKFKRGILDSIYLRSVYSNNGISNYNPSKYKSSEILDLNKNYEQLDNNIYFTLEQYKSEDHSFILKYDLEKNEIKLETETSSFWVIVNICSLSQLFWLDSNYFMLSIFLVSILVLIKSYTILNINSLLTKGVLHLEYLYRIYQIERSQIKDTEN
jgi:hypothetical protein